MYLYCNNIMFLEQIEIELPQDTFSLILILLLSSAVQAIDLNRIEKIKYNAVRQLKRVKYHWTCLLNSGIPSFTFGKLHLGTGYFSYILLLFKNKNINHIIMQKKFEFNHYSTFQWLIWSDFEMFLFPSFTYKCNFRIYYNGGRC